MASKLFTFTFTFTNASVLSRRSYGHARAMRMFSDLRDTGATRCLMIIMNDGASRCWATQSQDLVMGSKLELWNGQPKQSTLLLP